MKIMGFISRILVFRLEMLPWFQILSPILNSRHLSLTLPPRVLVLLNSLKLIKSLSASLFNHDSTSPPIWIYWLISLFQKIPLVTSARRPGDAEIVYASTYKAEKELNWKYVSLFFNDFFYRLYMFTLHLLFPICPFKPV